MNRRADPSDVPILPQREAVRFLTEATDLLLEAVDYETGLQALAERIHVDVAPGGAAVYVVGSDGHLHRGARSGDESDLRGDGDELVRHDADHPAARAVRRDRIVLVRREGESEVSGPEYRTGSERAVGAVLPLVARGRTLGALVLAFGGEGRRLGGEDIFFVRELARRVALGLDSARLLREAREGGQARVDFLSVMSHELRTPLTAIVGYADLIEAGISGPVTERQKEQLSKIKGSAWNLLGLIDGVLTYARFEGEEGQLDVEGVDPERVAEEAAVGARSVAEEKGLGLRVEVPEQVPPLRTDRGKAVRIVTQLIENAVKFTRSGDVRVSVTADEEHVRFRVSDTGIGIRDEHLESIWEPFWQAERVETRTAGGTGLGLSLARRLARLLEGEIEVESTPDEGSTFTLVLPRTGPGPTIP